MASPPSRHVPAHVKRALVDEAGGKCANPGCPAVRTELHHIEEWAVVRSHDAKLMIAICPTCHAAVHGGALRIDAATLLRWKRIMRPPRRRAHLYVEPSDSHEVIVGSFLVAGCGSQVDIVPPTSTSRLSYSLIHGDTLALDARITVLDEEILRVELGHLAVHDNAAVSVEQRPGHIRVLLQRSPREVLPSPVFKALVHGDRWFLDSQERLLLFECIVDAPGRVRLQGVWQAADGDVAVATQSAAYYFSAETGTCISLHGARGLMSGARGAFARPGHLGASAVFDFIAVAARSLQRR